MSSHGLSITVPLSKMLTDGYNAWLHVVDIVAKMLMQCHSNGCIYFVCLHIFNNCNS